MKNTEKEQSWPAVLDAVYSEYRHFMLRIAGSYIDDPQACEDVFHNAFLALIRNQARIMELTAPQLKAYLLLAVRHASIDYLRKERRMNLVDIPDGVLEELVSRPGESASASERSFRTVELYEVMRQLSVEDQTLLLGHYVVGLDSNELAQLLDCSPGGVRVKLHRANKRALALFSAVGLRLEDFLA